MTTQAGGRDADAQRLSSDADDVLERLLSPRVLRFLLELEERGGVGAAARVVGMTQPTASRALASIERELGYALVRRTPLGSTLTSQGAAVVGQARAVLAEYGQLHKLARSFDGQATTDLHLAASRTVGEHLVPQWLGAFARELPELRVSFHVDNSEAVIADVVSGQAPLGFVETPDLPATVHSEVLTHDRLVVIAPPGAGMVAASVDGGTAPLKADRFTSPTNDEPSETPVAAARANAITLADLGEVALVEREPGSGTRAMLDQLLPQRPSAIAQFDSNTAIVQAVAAGVGPAVLSELAVQEAVRTGKVREMEWLEAPPLRPLHAIWAASGNFPQIREAGQLPQPAAKILDVIRRAMAPSA